MSKDAVNFLTNLKEEVNKYIADVDIEAVEKSCRYHYECRIKRKSCSCNGIGKPGHVAGYVASLLSSTGTPTYELHGTEAVHGSKWSSFTWRCCNRNQQ